MKERRRRGPVISHERWLVSYADFVTLLFAFFVVLYASAQVDQRKVIQLSVAIESAFQQLGASGKAGGTGSSQSTTAYARRGFPSTGIPQMSAQPGSQALQSEQNSTQRGQEFASMRSQLEKALTNELKRNEVAMHMEPDGLVVSLREVGFFDSGSATIKPQAESAVSRLAEILQQRQCGLRIEGHTDPVPIHTAQFASNWELSTARATELVKLLIERHGFAPERLSAAGFAEYHPVASNETSSGRQMNRRVDIVILSSDSRRTVQAALP